MVGGWWKRIIKDLLKRFLGRRTLTFAELTTTVSKVEVIINCRPLICTASEHFSCWHPLISLQVTELPACLTTSTFLVRAHSRQNRNWDVTRLHGSLEWRGFGSDGSMNTCSSYAWSTKDLVVHPLTSTSAMLWSWMMIYYLCFGDLLGYLPHYLDAMVSPGPIKYDYSEKRGSSDWHKGLAWWKLRTQTHRGRVMFGFRKKERWGKARGLGAHDLKYKHELCNKRTQRYGRVSRLPLQVSTTRAKTTLVHWSVL